MTGDLSDCAIKAIDGLQGCAQLRNERLNQQLMGPDHCGIVGQRAGGTNTSDALLDEWLAAQIVFPEE